MCGGFCMSDTIAEIGTSFKEADFAWVAVYGDDDYLFQFADDGTENAYSKIEREKLKEFHLLDKNTGKTIYALALDHPDQRLIYRKRISMSGVSGEKQWEIALVGWQRKVGDENVQALAWVFPDGSIIQTGKFREDHPVFYGVELIDGVE